MRIGGRVHRCKTERTDELSNESDRRETTEAGRKAERVRASEREREIERERARERERERERESDRDGDLKK